MIFFIIHLAWNPEFPGMISNLILLMLQDWSPITLIISGNDNDQTSFSVSHSSLQMALTVKGFMTAGFSDSNVCSEFQAIPEFLPQNS